MNWLKDKPKFMKPVNEYWHKLPRWRKRYYKRSLLRKIFHNIKYNAIYGKSIIH
jgi:hypothetical protein